MKNEDIFIQILQDALETKNLNMTYWGRITDCGTQFCLAGRFPKFSSDWVLVPEYFNSNLLKLKYIGETDDLEPENQLREFFDLPLWTISNVFYPGTSNNDPPKSDDIDFYIKNALCQTGLNEKYKIIDNKIVVIENVV